jgi:hypothetical protein
MENQQENTIFTKYAFAFQRIDFEMATISFRIFATSKTTADEPLPTIPSYESPHGDLACVRGRHQLQICIP